MGHSRELNWFDENSQPSCRDHNYVWAIPKNLEFCLDISLFYYSEHIFLVLFLPEFLFNRLQALTQ